MDEDSFYVYLPSNVKSNSDSNTRTNYVTQLHTHYHLKGDWLVGLSEIHYNASWNDLTEDTNVNLESNKGDSVTIILNKGLHGSPKNIIADIQSYINKYDKRPVTERLNVGYESDTMTVINTELLPESVKEKKDSNKIKPSTKKKQEWKSDIKWKISFSRYLKRIFSIQKDMTYRDAMQIGTNPYRFRPAFDSLYVYTDIVEPTPLGDSYSNLLRIVNVPNEYKYDDVVVHHFDHVYYHKVFGNNIRTIEIDIRDNFGEKVELNTGVTLVVLHFKKVSKNVS